jgi:hypothetical protein
MARITHRNDRMHRGLVPTAQLGTGSATSATVLLGNQTWGSAPGASFGSNATDVGNASAGGASSSNSRADHVHRGVHSITAAGSNGLYGDVDVAAGSGIAVTVAGQVVTVASTGASLADVRIWRPAHGRRWRGRDRQRNRRSNHGPRAGLGEP